MKITIEGRSKELFKLAKSVLLLLREQHEVDIRYGKAVDMSCDMYEYIKLIHQKADEGFPAQDMQSEALPK